MNNVEARQWAQRIETSAGSYSAISYQPEDHSSAHEWVYLDGEFTFDQLNEILRMMRAAAFDKARAAKEKP
jgi:hypothetical protein